MRPRAWKKVRSTWTYAWLILVAGVSVLPVLWMLSAGLNSDRGVFAWPIELIPRHLQWANARTAWTALPLGQYLWNSFLAGLTSIALTVAFGLPAGVAFARFSFPGKKLLFVVVLATMMVPVSVIVIPLYLEMRNFGWVNNYYGLLFPTALWPFGIFIFRQAVAGIPHEYFEAAYIEGASEPYVILRVVVPLVRGSLTNVAIYAFILSYNSLLWPLIEVSSKHLRTVALGMQQFRSEVIGHVNLLMMVGLIGAVPVVLLFVALQRQFVNAAVAVGIKE